MNHQMTLLSLMILARQLTSSFSFLLHELKMCSLDHWVIWDRKQQIMAASLNCEEGVLKVLDRTNFSLANRILVCEIN